MWYYSIALDLSLLIEIFLQSYAEIPSYLVSALGSLLFIIYSLVYGSTLIPGVPLNCALRHVYKTKLIQDN